MDLPRFLELASTHGWRGMALWGVLLGQALLWIGLVRLYLAIRREQAPWEECVGKIRSALLRRVDGPEELEELKLHRYAPLVDALIALHFAEAGSEVFIRWILMRWKMRDGAEKTRFRTEQSFVVPKAEIAANGYDLSINRYKEVVHEVVEHAPPLQILAELKVLEAEIAEGMRELEGMLK